MQATERRGQRGRRGPWVTSTAEGETRKEGEHKEEATRQAGDAEIGGRNETVRRLGGGATRQIGDTSSGGGNEAGM